nr:hypothetical protein [Pseudomonas putida]
MKKTLLLSAIAVTLAGCGFTLASKAERALRDMRDFQMLSADEKMDLDHVRESSKGRFICGTVKTAFSPLQRFTIDGKHIHLTGMEPKSPFGDMQPWYDQACDQPELEDQSFEY